jgi:hypothetical protein
MADPAYEAPGMALCDPPGLLRNPPGAQLREFVEVFCGRDMAVWALARSYGGGLKRSRIRTVYWRLTMGDFPATGLSVPNPPRRPDPAGDPACLEHNASIVEGWLPHIAARREAYKKLHHQLLSPPNSKYTADEDATADNPLEHTNPQWRAYFRRQDWSKVIEKDLNRLDLSDDLDPFFGLPQMQRAMRAVIMTWAAANADVGYKQGMHELAAVLLLLVVRDARRRALEEADLEPLDPADRSPAARLRRALSVILDFQEFEADGYALLDLLLNRFRLREWYVQDAAPELTAGERCLHIQNSLVAKVEPMLAEHLVHLGVEPQVYALRWLRLLFLREFVVEDCFVLWDAVFAHGFVTDEGCELARWVMVAMLRYVKNDLIEADYAMCIRRLMRYPPTPDIHLFVASALEIACSEAGLKFMLAYGQDHFLAVQDEQYQAQCGSPPEPTRNAPDAGGQVTPGFLSPAARRRPKGLFDSDSDAENAEETIRNKMALLLGQGEPSPRGGAPPPLPLIRALPIRPTSTAPMSARGSGSPVCSNPLTDD